MSRFLIIPAGAAMGVTSNAMLLLGYIAGKLWGNDVYELIEADASAGTQTLQHRGSGNRYQIAVVQLEGSE